MAKFLLDENLSPRIARHLRQAYAFDAMSVLDLGLSGSGDVHIRATARQLDRVLLTLDRDFADSTNFKFQTPPGIIWINAPRSLRTIPGEIRLLDRFFEREALGLKLDISIIEIDAFISKVLYIGDRA